MFGDRLEDVHGVLFCCHAEICVIVVFANWRPEVPLGRLLGTLLDATLMAVCPTAENVNPEQASISVYFEAENAVVVTDSAFRDWPEKVYCVFAERLEEVHGLLFCCHPEKV